MTAPLAEGVSRAAPAIDLIAIEGANGQWSAMSTRAFTERKKELFEFPGVSI
jgi:hypothetical protein